MAPTDSGSTGFEAAAVESIVFRVAESERDRSAVIEGEFWSDTVFEVACTDGGFTIRPDRLDPPVHKIFPDDEPRSDEPDGDARSGSGAAEQLGGERRFVALHRDRVIGYVDTEYEPWNRRLIIADIEVTDPYQGRGVGRTLMDRAVDRARECGAGHVWLEVSNINGPAVRAYQRMGFSFCGLDTSLYRGTASEGETALFMSLLLD